MPENGDFDFISDDQAEDETATSGSPKPVFGTLTPEIIKEARAANGLDIDKFYKKYGLSVNVEKLLLGPLDENGNLK